jgi:hypothetical protein
MTSQTSKKDHNLSDSDNEIEIDNASLTSPKPQYHCFLLSNFDPKFQNCKQLFQQFLKYVPRTAIIELKPTKNGVLIKSPDPHFATTIRNRHTFEIFGHSATITALVMSETVICHSQFKP